VLSPPDAHQVIYIASYAQRRVETRRGGLARDAHLDVEASRQAPRLAATTPPPDDHLGGWGRQQKKPPVVALHLMRRLRTTSNPTQNTCKRLRRTYRVLKNTSPAIRDTSF